MASDDSLHPLAESGVTIRSDSEQYSQGEDLTESPPSSNSPLILYKPPTFWGLVRGAAINLFLPFINGMMLGFGELFAHEAAYRLGWGSTKVRPKYPARLATASMPRPTCTHTDTMWQTVWMQKANKKTNTLQVFPMSRRRTHAIGPGLEVRDKHRKPTTSLDDLTSLE
ncbi:Mitochondrial import protein 1 [Colletotrichum tanaceti]|uniref:Mitochondrial import protein 1 n=1 Tax=Colletotrichum tanaceti TaxID=1306861 RepID=A0A4V6DGF9_9PEZI|nr:Mitochondrial import protein 1 [Colletotrichum tanaceti]